MKKFKFKLESLLKIREYAAKEWEVKLAEANSKCEVVRQKIRSNEAKRVEAVKRLEEMGSSDLEYFYAVDEYINRLKDEERRAKEKLKVLDAERKKVLEQYTEVLRQFKIVEKLKEKAFDAYKKEYKQFEVKRLDEANITRA